MRIGIPKNVPIETRICLQKLASALDINKSPTFASFNLSDLTASRLVSSDSDKNLVSTDLNSWITGVANEVDITDDGDGTVTIGIVNPLIVAKGGTGVATLTDGGLLLGSGTGAITPLGQATNGQLPIGSTGADPVLAALTEGAGVTITNAAGSITVATTISQYTDEMAQDTIGGILTDSATINFTYDDGANTITAITIDGGIDHDSLINTHNLTTDLQPSWSNIQSIDAEISALAGLTSAANKLPYYTGSGTASLCDLTAFARTILDDAAATNVRTTLGLVIGTNVQAYDAGLTNLAGIVMAADKFYYTSADNTHVAGTVTAFARSILDDANEATFKATVNLEIGTDIQAQGDVLDDLNTLGANSADSEFLVGTGAGALAWESGSTARTSLGLGTGDSPVFTKVGIGITPVEELHISATGAKARIDAGAAGSFSSVQCMSEDPFTYNCSWLQYGTTATGTKVGLNRAGNSFLLLTPATAGAIGTENATPLNLCTNSTIRITIASDGVVTLAGNMIIPDGGTIGQTAGPLLTFNDTSNYLGITGCKVGIGTTTPANPLHILGADVDGVLCNEVYSDELTAHQPGFRFRKSHSDTPGTRATTLTGENLGVFIFRGVDSGNAWDYGAYIQVAQNGVAGVRVPTDIKFVTYSATAANANQLVLYHDGNIGIGLTPHTKLTIGGSLTLLEQAAADGDTAAYGQIWVKTATPNELWFTSDDGVDHQIAYV